MVGRISNDRVGTDGYWTCGHFVTCANVTSLWRTPEIYITLYDNHIQFKEQKKRRTKSKQNKKHKCWFLIAMSQITTNRHVGAHALTSSGLRRTQVQAGLSWTLRSALPRHQPRLWFSSKLGVLTPAFQAVARIQSPAVLWWRSRFLYGCWLETPLSYRPPGSVTHSGCGCVFSSSGPDGKTGKRENGGLQEIRSDPLRKHALLSNSI